MIIHHKKKFLADLSILFAIITSTSFYTPSATDANERNGGTARTIDLSSLDANTGFSIKGISENDLLGRSVSLVGDLDNDGFDDLAILSYGSPHFRGEAYIVYGSDTELPDFAGGTLSSSSDLNNDGFDDILIGAELTDRAVSTCVNQLPLIYQF